MRTTIDLPDNLLRQAKARAALRGIKLKDLVADALRASLYGQVAESPSSGQGESDETDTLILGKRCVFPLITGECGPALADLSPDGVHRILEDEDVERAHTR